MIEPRDPIERWRAVSARAAVATGYRHRVGTTVMRNQGVGFGVATAALIVIVVGLAVRPAAGPGSSPSPSTAANEPVVATTDDGVFRLSLTTPRATYGPDDAIEPVATITYLGPEATVTVYHADQSIGFRIEEVDGTRVMGGGMRQPCRSTELISGVPSAVPFSKAGSPGDGFDRAWYEDPVLRLPVGTWRITAGLDAYLGTGNACGAERHQLTVTNDIRVVEDGASPDPSVSLTEASPSVPSPSSGVSPSPTASKSPVPATTASPGPATGSSEDGMFRLELSTPRGTYGPDDAIEPIATVTYLGPKSSETIYHAASPVGFLIQEVGGARQMDGGMDEPCLNTAVERDVPIAYSFEKAGTTEHGFDRAWYEDPVLHLPVGTWRIRAYLDAAVADRTADCGGVRHRLEVENVIVVR